MSRRKGIVAKLTTPETASLRAGLGDAFAEANEEDRGLASCFDEMVSGNCLDVLIEKSLGAYETELKAKLAEEINSPSGTAVPTGKLEDWIPPGAIRFGLETSLKYIRATREILDRIATAGRTGNSDPAQRMLEAVAAFGKFRATKRRADPWFLYLFAAANSPSTPGQPRMIQATKAEIFRFVQREMKRDGLMDSPSLDMVADKLRQYGFACLEAKRGGKRKGAGRPAG